ncbi:alcohol dehydrogenase catalytic domain-containing protein [Amycolatopsis sp. YIM 10]|uniref:alcohol dehydrogenase catalytic domain-containing protein n=1 Tax=Amycolatopsis sp. YIM 10 TaxID=2653857 RepID=UPI0012906E4F|nr:alcohol dehydrogenase catalytic domain-containing protein [Amycolatopsis sp. YIM 10]QFU91074.1 Alcohol dehydrogenase [Amycolatopsis sp. YIM 10]
MRAFRMIGANAAALEDVPEPVPGPGEVRLDVLAAGVCRSDLAVLAGGVAAGYALPFTFGHEICGRVAALGPGEHPVAIGDQVVVHAPVGCGKCGRCGHGETNYCDNSGSLTAAGLGLGLDGGMAEAVTVDSARLVAADGLDPVQASVLADAGLTSYHAVAGSLPMLSQPEAVAVVIGVGGLGHLALGVLQSLTDARVIAVDTREEALELARAHGATTAVALESAAEAVAAATGGRGADVVFDFAAAPSSVELAPSLLRTAGDLVVVGSGGGVLPVTKPGPLPAGCRIRLPFWGSRNELTAVVALARGGSLPVRAEVFGLSEAGRVFDLLRAGKITGRAVLDPRRG